MDKKEVAGPLVRLIMSGLIEHPQLSFGRVQFMCAIERNRSAKTTMI
jgi:hypothetical protein